jgi:hypothetical protein
VLYGNNAAAMSTGGGAVLSYANNQVTGNATGSSGLTGTAPLQ